jgi:hypothetical protein
MDTSAFLYGSNDIMDSKLLNDNVLLCDKTVNTQCTNVSLNVQISVSRSNDSIANQCSNENISNNDVENFQYEVVNSDCNETLLNHADENLIAPDTCNIILTNQEGDNLHELSINSVNDVDEDSLCEVSLLGDENIDVMTDSNSESYIPNAENEIVKIRNEYLQNLIIGHLNVNSMVPKFQEIHELIVRCKFEVMVFSETKLDTSCRDAMIEIKDYTMYRQDKQSNSGGIVVYVSKNIPSTHGPVSMVTDEIEYVSIELNLEDSKMLILAMYKNPKMNPNKFKNVFEKLCEDVLEKYEHVIIIGDLNFNMLQNNVLSQLCPTFNLTNVINEPTCFKSNNATLIDVMLVTKRKKYIKGFSIDTGISDFHNLIGGVLRQHKPTPQKKTIYYRKLSKIDYEKVNHELMILNVDSLVTYEENADDSFNKLHEVMIRLLDKHAPKVKKTIKKNDFHCMSKRLKKAILTRNQYRNKFFKHRNPYYLALYRKFRNAVTIIKREEIKKYFEEKCKENTKNKDFWKTIKPIFSKSKTKNDNIPLREESRIITDCKEVCEIFNNFFCEIGADIGVPENNQKSMEEIIDGYSNHPSLNVITNKINISQCNVELSEVSEGDVRKIIKKLSSKKASGYDEIPVKFIKKTSTHLVKPITIIANKCIQQNIFPEKMKMANITPLYKKKDKLNKDNYRSINLLIALSKILEKILSNQIYEHMKKFFHDQLSGFRKGYGCNDILTKLCEDWRQALDEGNIVGAVAIDLSKAFDCMPHGLLLAKLKAYGFSLNVCKLLKSYLVNRKHRVKIGDTYSNWTRNKKGVPQGSILGPLLFNVFINDLLYHNIKSNIYNYADDNTLSYVHKDITQITNNLEADCLVAKNWFMTNNMKANADKFQLMFLSRNQSYHNHSIKLENCTIKATTSITILGVEFDEKLNFNNHFDELCNQTSKQINALKRMKHYLDKPCKKIIYNSYISSNFNYCPTVWMFAGKTNMEKLEKTNKRALRFVVNDNEAEYDQICRDENELSIYKRCIKAAAIQMYKIKNQLAPAYIQNLFTRKESVYDIRDNDLFNIPRFKTVNYGKKSFRYYGAKLWSNIPTNLKEKNSIHSFKFALTNWLQNIDTMFCIEYL